MKKKNKETTKKPRSKPTSAKSFADLKKDFDAFKRDPDGEALKALKALEERESVDFLGRKIKPLSVAEVERWAEKQVREDEQYRKRIKGLNVGTYCAAAA